MRKTLRDMSRRSFWWWLAVVVVLLVGALVWLWTGDSLCGTAWAHGFCPERV